MSAPIRNSKVEQLVQSRVQATGKNVSSPDFSQLLENSLKVSAHAQTRLKSRNIEMGAEEWGRIQNGIERAAQKGARESLVMIDDIALVVSIKNRTVITAVDKGNLKDNVFTNIDSAVIV